LGLADLMPSRGLSRVGVGGAVFVQVRPEFES
jgi:hypothetical protein